MMQALQRTQQRHAKSKQEHRPPKTKRTQANKNTATKRMHTREQTKHQHTCFSARTLRWDRKRAVGLRKRTKAQQKVSEHETLGRHEQKHETPGEQKHETLGRTSTRTRTRTRTSVFAKFHLCGMVSIDTRDFRDKIRRMEPLSRVGVGMSKCQRPPNARCSPSASV